MECPRPDPTNSRTPWISRAASSRACPKVPVRVLAATWRPRFRALPETIQSSSSITSRITMNDRQSEHQPRARRASRPLALDFCTGLLRDEGGFLVVDADRVHGPALKIAAEIDVQLVRAVDHRAGRVAHRHPIENGHGDRLSCALNLVPVLCRAAARQACCHVQHVLRWI